MDFDSTAWQHIDALQIGRQSIKLLVTALIGRIRKTNLILGVVIAVLAVAILPSILVNNDPAAEKNAVTLNRGLIGDAESLDPHEFSTKQAGDVLRDIGEGLVTYSADGKLASGVALSWDVSPDGRVYTFKIRPEARWSNGQRLQPIDFVRTYKRLADPKNGARNTNFIKFFEHAEEILRGEVPPNMLAVRDLGSNVLEISLSNNVPFFLQALAHPSMFPIYAEENSDYRAANKNEVTNGAYVLDEWKIGSEIRLRKNKFYWDATNTYFDRVSYHIVSELAEYDRFRAGEIDITSTIASGIFQSAQRDFMGSLKVSPYLSTYYYGFNMTNPQFGENEDLRAALSLAIDREVLVRKVLARGEVAAYSWVPPGVNYYSPKQNLSLAQPRAHRELEAVRYYTRAGYSIDNPVSFELRYNVSDVQQRIALAVASMWREVLGAEVTLVSEEFRVLLSNIREKSKTDVFRLSWTGEYNDAQSFLEIFQSNNPSNMTGFSDERYDLLIQSAKSESDPSIRRKSLELAEEVLMNAYPIIPIYFYVSKHLVNPRIIGWANNVMDIHLSKHLTYADS